MKRDPAPRRLRLLASVALVTATVTALLGLPGDELPGPWLLAFTVPGAILGSWSRFARAPWQRAIFAVVLQAGACWGALAWAGPMSRPAALACTILPPLAFATTRNHDADPSLALFLSFCVLLVAVILDGLKLPLLLAYGCAAFLSLHVSTLLAGYRASNPRRAHVPARPNDLAATSGLLLACLLAVFALERTLSCLPSPSRAGDTGGRSGGSAGPLQVGLDDSFRFDGPSGLLSDLGGEQLLRAEAIDGTPLPEDLYLRCGFFAVPGVESWRIGRLELQHQSHRGQHVLRQPVPSATTQQLAVERFAGAQKFLFLPPHSLRIEGISGLLVDPQREWIRPETPSDEPYVVVYHDVLPPPGARPDLRTRRQGLLTFPAGLDPAPFERLLRRWRANGSPQQVMAAIANGLARHCRYDRSTPTGPYASELENFLFADDDRHGYCMHFASAAALMLRLRGVPCRIGVGLYGGDPDSIIDGARVFGSQHAHAWVEVPYEGRGFVVFDPTPARARGRAFVPDSRPLQEAEPDARDHTGPLTPIASALRDLLAAPWPWALALAIAFAIAVFPRRPPGAPQRATYPVEPGARRALRRLLRALARAGHQRTPNQTLELFARELDRRNRLPDEVAAAFRCYQEVRFGGRPFDDDRSQVMERAVQSAARLRSAREPSN